MATDIPKWWQQPSTSASPTQTQTRTQTAGQMHRWAIIPISIDKLKASHLDTSACQNIDFSSKRFARNTKTQAHRQLDGWMNAWNDNNDNKSSGYISMPNVDLFFQMICLQYSNSIPRMVREMDECMKWQQYPSASTSSKGKSSGYINMPIFMLSLLSDLSANVQKPEKVVNERTDGLREGQKKSGWRVFLCHPHLDAG